MLLNGNRNWNIPVYECLIRLNYHSQIVLGCKNTLVNLKKNSIIYATIYYYVFICRRSNEGGG